MQFIGVTLAAVMGLQHSLAMVGGIITPPLLVAAAANNVRTQQFLISSSLIVSGICTVIHCIQLKIPFTGGRLFYGTGAVTFPGAGHECG
jgi:xanthine/uracil permease